MKTHHSSMGSLTCLSSAPNLRCESFSRLQSELLIIPPAIEVIFSVSLVFANWKSSGSKRHYLLSAEGVVYFFLALLDMLVHIIPAVTDSLRIFSVLDIFIAAASSVPLLFYTLFLFLFASGELLHALPSRFQSTVKYLIMIFVPAIVILNEIASFVGISRRMINGTILAMGFETTRDQTLWTFFSALTLALLTAYQAISFSLTFYQLIRVIINKRRIEVSGSDEAHMARGIGWIAAGLKLGAIESVVGYADAGFGVPLTRRILRLIARACLIIGVVKGVDTAEDFRNLENELRGQPKDRENRLKKDLISNPRNSTFRRLSLPPQMSMIYSETPRTAPQPRNIPQPDIPATGYQSTNYLWSARYSGSKSVSTPGLNPQRVTINYEKGRAPTLEMRFSALNIPSPAVIAESIKSRPDSEWLSVGVPSPNESLASAWNSMPVSRKSSLGRPAISQRSLPTDTVSFTIDRHPFAQQESVTPSERLASDPFEAMRDKYPRVAGRSRSIDIEQEPDFDEDYYPNIPVLRQSNFSHTHKSGNSFASTVNTISPSNSLLNKGKRVPPLPTTPIYTLYDGQNIAQPKPKWVGSQPKEEEEDAYERGPEVSSPFGLASRGVSEAGTPDTDVQSPFGYDDRALATGKSQELTINVTGDSVHSGDWLATASKGGRDHTTTASDIEAYRAGVRVTKGASRAVSEASTEFGDRVTSIDSVQIPWLINDVAPARGVWTKSELVNIKDVKIVGAVPRKTTPRPEQHEFERNSLTLERMEMPSDVSLKRLEEGPTTRRDSGTLPLGYAF